MRNPVNWFEIYVQDISKAKAFYEAVFQIEMQLLDHPGVEIFAFPMEKGAAGAPGVIMQAPGCSSGAMGTTVYFSCMDCAEEAARAAEHGGSVFKEKSSIGEWGYIAIIKDLDGNMVGLHSQK